MLVLNVKLNVWSLLRTIGCQPGLERAWDYFRDRDFLGASGIRISHMESFSSSLAIQANMPQGVSRHFRIVIS